jgi:hypothetical protein
MIPNDTLAQVTKIQKMIKRDNSIYKTIYNLNSIFSYNNLEIVIIFI